MPADFSLLQTPNFGQAALSGYKAGAAIGKQRQLDQAMAGIDLDRPETLLPVLRVDPSTGAALIGASVKLHAENREVKAAAALGDAAGNYFGVGNGSLVATPEQRNDQSRFKPAYPNAPRAADYTGTAAAQTVPDPNAAPGSDQTDIVVTAKPQAPIQPVQPNMGQTVARLLHAGVPLDQATQFVNLAGTMSKAQKDALADQQDALGVVATSIPKGISLAERTAWVQAHKPYLLSHNVPEAQIDGFVPTDENINALQVTAIGVKEALTMQHQAQIAAESARHNKVEEGQGSARIGLEAQNVGISAGHLALDRQKEGREAQKQVGGVSAMSTEDLLALARRKH